MEVKVPLVTSLRVRILNQIEIWFIQEAWVDV